MTKNISEVQILSGLKTSEILSPYTVYEKILGTMVEHRRLPF